MTIQGLQVPQEEEYNTEDLLDDKNVLEYLATRLNPEGIARQNGSSSC